MPFEYEAILDILRGNKRITIRDGWEFAEEGDKMFLMEREFGAKFGTIEIENKEEMTLYEIAKEDWDGHKNFASVEDAVKYMRQYYGDIQVEDTVTVLTFSVLSSPHPEYQE